MKMEMLVETQRDFFNTNQTKSLSFRKQQLIKLQKSLEKYEEELYRAVYKDLSKSKTETYMAEVSIVYTEIKYAIKHLSQWSKPQKVRGSMASFPAKNRIYKEPFGVVLILSPWNYPIQLALAPLVGAIAAGNCAVLKTSSSSAETSKVLMKMINETFESQYVYCAPADMDYDEIVGQVYDYIFFTGSPRVGKIIMKAASEHLTPLSLELGGKSPCLITKDADLQVAAKRIVWGKFLNAGQTCITIDYLLVEESVKEAFVEALKHAIELLYHDALSQYDYPKIITQHHYERLMDYINDEKDKQGHSLYGGKGDPKHLKIEPTLFEHAAYEDPIMEEEIFGPILPIITYQDLNQAIADIKKRPKPLACYIFTKDKQKANKLIHEVSFGGGCVNDVLMHVANHHLPFGGVGNSGMGAYHGKYSFDTFSREKAVVKNTTLIDIPLRYPPYDDKSFKWLKHFI